MGCAWVINRMVSQGFPSDWAGVAARMEIRRHSGQSHQAADSPHYLQWVTEAYQFDDAWIGKYRFMWGIQAFQEWCGYATDRMQDEQMQAEEAYELSCYMSERSEQGQIQQK